jgi:alkanesulfonate monooxygenase SsuD/methylene tetrahydromethanopterin reductase-like flavin-dependent oxidoreductase (luciferase family)
MTDIGAFLSLRYDLRAPAFGAPPEALYQAALEQCAWAEENGFLMATLSEHHGSEDGYCPSPVVMAAAIAGRTRNLRIMIAALVLPLYDPIRVAEDLAVLDLASGGRVDVILGAGYRREELEMFGRTLDERIPLLEEGIEVLRQAWTGEEFEYRGRRVRVTPRPARPEGPGLILGGASPAAARRAARLGLGFLPVDASVWGYYQEACAELGRDVGPAPGLDGPRFIHVADDPDEAWARIAPHAFHDTNVYGAWLASANERGPYEMTDDVDSLRTSGAYVVITPDECVARIRETGSLMLHPLMGGLDPDLAWESLELIASKVIPRLGAPD